MMILTACALIAFKMFSSGVGEEIKKNKTKHVIGLERVYFLLPIFMTLMVIKNYLIERNTHHLSG
jgi:hypothetical protein